MKSVYNFMGIKFSYMLEIDILRNSSQNNLNVLGCAFLESGCPNRHPDALLAKTMVPPEKVTLKSSGCVYILIQFSTV